MVWAHAPTSMINPQMTLTRVSINLATISHLCLQTEGTQANSQNLSDDLDEGLVDASGDIDAQLSIEAPKAEVDLVDNRPKKLTGLELIKENVKELHEVIAYMDYSFERAFTIQEKEYMLAYKVSDLRYGVKHCWKLTKSLICLL